MASSIPVELVNQIQIWAREQAGLSEYDPARSAHLPTVPPLSGNVAAMEPSAPDMRCKKCKGRLLGGVQSLLCIYCGRLNHVAVPVPIFFKDTIAYSWLLHSLNLDGSELVENNETTRGQGAPKDNISLSELLNFQISFRSPPDNAESDVESKDIDQKSSVSLWNGIELDDFFLESEMETVSSVYDKPVISSQVQLEATKSVTTDKELSGWQADFQPPDNGLQNNLRLSGHSPAPPIDLSTHIDSVFGSGKDEISITSSTPDNWTSHETQDISFEAFPQSPDFDLSRSGNNNQIQNKIEKPSPSGDWFQADEWGFNNVDQPHKATIADDDDSFAEWNDFTSFTNTQDPPGSLFMESNTPGPISHEKPSDLNLFSFDDQHSDMDVSGLGRPDPFSDSFSKNDDILQVNNISAGVSSSERSFDLTSVVQDGGEHVAANVEYSNLPTNTKEDVHALISEMHDLSFMLKDDLTIPTKSADSHNFFL